MNVRKTHFSWLLTSLSVGVTIGVFIGVRRNFLLPTEVLPLLLLVIVVSFHRRTRLACFVLILMGVLIGGIRGGSDKFKQQVFLQKFEGTARFEGIVTNDPSFGIEGETRFVLSSIHGDDGLQYNVSVWVEIPKSVAVKRADRVIVSGVVAKGFGPYAASLYRARLDQRVQIKNADIAGAIRDNFARGIHRILPEPDASLGAGFLLGQKTNLPEKLQNELRLLGITHIVVASGYNLTVLIRFSRRLFMKVSRMTALVTSLLFVYFFMQMTGASPSMSRAGFIASVSLLAWFFGRKIHPAVLVSLSAGITVFITPAYAHNDLGWLLSFASFVGVLLLSPLIHAYFWGDKKPHWIRQLLVETASAQICTVPIILLAFGTFSPLSLLANAMVVPLIPFAMLFVFVSGIAHIIIPFSAIFLSIPAKVLLRYMVIVIDKLSLIPLASDSVPFSNTAFLISYVAIISAMIFMWRRSGHEFREYNIIE